jgi:hypothetical protein
MESGDQVIKGISCSIPQLLDCSITHFIQSLPLNFVFADSAACAGRAIVTRAVKP